jgi:hypothetical protein
LLCRLGHHPVDEDGRHVELPLGPTAQFRGWNLRRRLIILAAVTFLLHRPGDVLAGSQSFAQDWVAKLKDLFFGVLAQTIKHQLTVISQREVDLRGRQLDGRAAFRVRDFIELLDGVSLGARQDHGAGTLLMAGSKVPCLEFDPKHDGCRGVQIDRKPSRIGGFAKS